MPTVSGSGEEVESQDEVKVFKYEGDEEESEKRSSENLTEDKSSLITETEENKSTHVPSSSSFAIASKSDGRLPEASSPFGLFGASAWGADRLGYLSPFAYAYTNGTSAMVSSPPFSASYPTGLPAATATLRRPRTTLREDYHSCSIGIVVAKPCLLTHHEIHYEVLYSHSRKMQGSITL
nr:protein pangolin, isoforms A/H/I/S-like [Procambarus clarkii]